MSQRRSMPFLMRASVDRGHFLRFRGSRGSVLALTTRSMEGVSRAGDRVTSNERATVFGAYGHTGRFVVAELRRRGWTPVLSGRNQGKLTAAAQGHAGAELRVARVDDPSSLDAAISGSSVVINCAGPFIDTAVPIVEAAIRSRVHYLDVAAEQSAVLSVFERFRGDQRITGTVIAPAMAFFGGLGDLMATTAMGEWDNADEVCIAVALDGWKPTRGTRLTGQRNPGKRFIFSNGRLQRVDPPAGRKWVFPAPFGEQEVAVLGLAETIIISRHIRTSEIRVFMNLAPLADLRDPETPPPLAEDESGRSSQVFLMDVIARRGRNTRRVIARGRDIYAVTAPIVVEAAQRVVSGAIRTTGVVAAGEVFDARDFLDTLDPAHVAVNVVGDAPASNHQDMEARARSSLD
jgi:Saccharopine dehydrogenase NADP binding domain